MLSLVLMAFVFFTLMTRPVFEVLSDTRVSSSWALSLSSSGRQISSAKSRSVAVALSSSRPTFLSASAFFMIQSITMMNSRGDNTEPWRTPEVIWNLDTQLKYYLGRHS